MVGMNKIGIYYAFWTHEWNEDFNPYIDKVAKLGFDILEINGGTVANMTQAERKELKGHADDCGITLSYCYGTPASQDIASKDAETRKRGVDFLKKQASAIGEMGGGNLGGIIYSYWPAYTVPDDDSKPAILERSVKSMKEAAKVAEGENVFFCVEVVNRFENFLLNTSAEAVEYCKLVGSPNVKVMLDTFHMNIEENTIDEAITTAGGYLGHVHIGENNRRPPGYGHIPWNEFAKALKKINYEGNIVMEPFLMPGGQVGKDIKVWRDMSVGVDLDAEAGKAVKFMRDRLVEA
jgi:D-psicose/D-tagatose/L-ribulose 3-epimerase